MVADVVSSLTLGVGLFWFHLCTCLSSKGILENASKTITYLHAENGSKLAFFYMYAFGDESGHPKDPIEKREPFCVAVVAGDQEDCIRCPKKAVRRVSDIDEAKWNDLTDTQKRRVIKCFNQNTDRLSLGYGVITHSDMLASRRHRFYEDSLFDGRPTDMCVQGLAYSVVLQERGFEDRPSNQFVFDKIHSSRQAEYVKEQVQSQFNHIRITFTDSRTTKGIQAADCLAGAALEPKRGGYDWLAHIDSVRVCCASDEIVKAIRDVIS